MIGAAIAQQCAGVALRTEPRVVSRLYLSDQLRLHPKSRQALDTSTPFRFGTNVTAKLCAKQPERENGRAPPLFLHLLSTHSTPAPIFPTHPIAVGRLPPITSTTNRFPGKKSLTNFRSSRRRRFAFAACVRACCQLSDRPLLIRSPKPVVADRAPSQKQVSSPTASRRLNTRKTTKLAGIKVLKLSFIRPLLGPSPWVCGGDKKPP